jgi:hypothetical protein
MISFSQGDLKDPASLERVLRQFEAAINVPVKVPVLPTTAQLVSQLSPLIQKELQARGSSPLNLQSLLPNSASGGAVVIEDTHARRLSNFVGSNIPPVGSLFWEIDRTVLYLVKLVAGVAAWVFAAGSYTNTRTNYPSDLGANDAGFLFQISDYAHLARFDGTAWRLTEGSGGYIVASAFALASGYQICDGTATDYITDNTTNLAVSAFTTPDLKTANANTYLRSAAAYTGAVNAPTNPTFGGALSNTGADSGSGTIVQSGTGTTVATHTHTHPFTPTGNVSLAGGDPVQFMNVIYYFRR